MQAAIFKQTGIASEVLDVVDINKPEPGPNEVLVKVHTSGVNPTDTKTRAGIFPIQGSWDRIVPHHDGAGIIEAVGDSVLSRRVGERVWLHSAQWAGADGTAAEYVVVGAQNAVPLPDNVSFEAGATFGVPLLTAYHAVTLDGSVEGKTVLVQGGAGAVGNYAIQIARRRGANVIATVSSEAKAAAARSAGAHEVINYLADDVVERVMAFTDGIGVDHVVEVNLGANAMQLPELVKVGGYVAVYGTDDFAGPFPMVGSVVRQLRFGFFIVFALPEAALATALADLTEMLAAGAITAPIHATLPLSDVARAHDLVDAKSTIGNIVLAMA